MPQEASLFVQSCVFVTDNVKGTTKTAFSVNYKYVMLYSTGTWYQRWLNWNPKTWDHKFIVLPIAMPEHSRAYLPLNSIHKIYK